MKRIRVVVTAEDIAVGEPVWDRCPIARGLHRAGFPHATVSPDDWRPGAFRGLHFLSRRAAKFVDDFDHGRPVRPTWFYLEGPER